MVTIKSSWTLVMFFLQLFPSGFTLKIDHFQAFKSKVYTYSLEFVNLLWWRGAHSGFACFSRQQECELPWQLAQGESDGACQSSISFITKAVCLYNWGPWVMRRVL